MVPWSLPLARDMTTWHTCTHSMQMASHSAHVHVHVHGTGLVPTPPHTACLGCEKSCEGKPGHEANLARHRQSLARCSHEHVGCIGGRQQWSYVFITVRCPYLRLRVRSLYGKPIWCSLHIVYRPSGCYVNK